MNHADVFLTHYYAPGVTGHSFSMAMDRDNQCVIETTGWERLAQNISQEKGELLNSFQKDIDEFVHLTTGGRC